MLYLKYFTKFKKIHAILQKRRFHKSGQLFTSLEDSPNITLDKNIYDRYMCLPIPECKVQVTYIWIDGTGIDLRSKTRTLKDNPSSYKDVPLWTFNGYGTHQATVDNSDCYLVPVALYNDPITRGNNKLVLCEAFSSDEKPMKTNYRQKCVEVLNKVGDQEVEIGFEQEYFLTDYDGRPFGWPRGGDVKNRGNNYCAVGASRVFGREIIECFYRCCLYTGLCIHSMMPETVPGQWEFKTEPTLCIKSADDLWIARWLIQRVAEDYGVDISFAAKHVEGWSGSGLHVDFSTKRMRADGGYKHIEEAMKRLEQCHKEYIKSCDVWDGKDTKKRLIGKLQTSKIDRFTWGVGDRSASIKVSKQVASKKKGEFEDRRPSASADPYRIITALVSTIIL